MQRGSASNVSQFAWPTHAESACGGAGKWEKLPIMHLICHAAEMFLKLGLYKTGSDDGDMKVDEIAERGQT